MTRTYYRLSLCAASALAAVVGPVIFLEDQFRPGYLLGGLGAAFLAWALEAGAIGAEQNLHVGLQAVMGTGAAVLSWATISLVAVFDIIPHMFETGPDRFDPVWVMGGLSPLMIPVVAWWRFRRQGITLWRGLISALYRYSVPLLGLQLVARFLGLPKQYLWLFLFTGVMFLVLDGLGVGGDLPFLERRRQG